MSKNQSSNEANTIEINQKVKDCIEKTKIPIMKQQIKTLLERFQTLPLSHDVDIKYYRDIKLYQQNLQQIPQIYIANNFVSINCVEEFISSSNSLQNVQQETTPNCKLTNQQLWIKFYQLVSHKFIGYFNSSSQANQQIMFQKFETCKQILKQNTTYNQFLKHYDNLLFIYASYQQKIRNLFKCSPINSFSLYDGQQESHTKFKQYITSIITNCLEMESVQLFNNYLIKALISHESNQITLNITDKQKYTRLLVRNDNSPYATLHCEYFRSDNIHKTAVNILVAYLTALVCTDFQLAVASDSDIIMNENSFDSGENCVVSNFIPLSLNTIYATAEDEGQKLLLIAKEYVYSTKYDQRQDTEKIYSLIEDNNQERYTIEQLQKAENEQEPDIIRHNVLFNSNDKIQELQKIKSFLKNVQTFKPEPQEPQKTIKSSIQKIKDVEDNIIKIEQQLDKDLRPKIQLQIKKQKYINMIENKYEKLSLKDKEAAQIFTSKLQKILQD